MFTTNPSMRDSLLCALMQVYVTKLKGKHKNPELPAKAMNFFIACESTSRKAFDFVSANMLGPCLRTIQRRNATTRQPSIICISTSDLESRLVRHFKTLPDYDKSTLTELLLDLMALKYLQSSHYQRALVLSLVESTRII